MPLQATAGDVQRRYERTLQARGHWFEPSCAHQIRSLFRNASLIEKSNRRAKGLTAADVQETLAVGFPRAACRSPVSAGAGHPVRRSPGSGRAGTWSPWSRRRPDGVGRPYAMPSPPTGPSPGRAWNRQGLCPASGEVKHAGLEGPPSRRASVAAGRRARRAAACRGHARPGSRAGGVRPVGGPGAAS